MSINLDYTKVFGYYSPADIESVAESPLRKFLVFHDVMNALAIVASPIAGVIRAVVSAAMFYFYSKKYPNTEDKTILNIKRFLIAEMVRGVGEFFGLGPIFGVVDIIVTLNRYELLCFSKSERTLREGMVRGWIG